MFPLTMRITTWNVNGLRAALRKGLPQQLEKICPDVLLLQEIRCLPEQLPEEFRTPSGWHVYWNPAEKRGYSGTAIWSRWPIRRPSLGIGCRETDSEGRVITAEINGLEISSVYLPSGSSGPHRQEVKNQWLRKFKRWAARQQSRAPVVLGGDLNIAHTERDIFYARANEGTSGFLPHERSWFGELLNAGWHDLVREHVGEVQGPYSWWSNRGRARELDRGWRIDYLLCNASARPLVESATIDREAALEISDHAPVTVELKI